MAADAGLHCAPDVKRRQVPVESASESVGQADKQADGQLARLAAADRAPSTRLDINMSELVQ